MSLTSLQGQIAEMVASPLFSTLNSLRARGYIRDAIIRDSFDSRSVEVEVVLPNRDLRRFVITADEVRMGGSEAVAQFAEVIRYSVVASVGTIPVIQRTQPPQQRWFDTAGLQDLGRYNSSSDFTRPPNYEAESRAQALFREVAGEEAYEKLRAKTPLPMRGSAGGRYFLHHQASYCVTRKGDGARLCAVVPGVPLWDHLLGVKLMVEHDEPKFLRVANVAGGPRNNFWDLWDPGLRSTRDRFW